MSRPGTPPDPVESATTLHAQAVAALLQSRNEVSSRSSVLRFRELARQTQTGKQLGTNLSVPTCRRCGTFIIPGWTGSMQLSRKKPGRRQRRREDDEGDRRAMGNKQQWLCRCGWTQDIASSDNNKRRKFKRRRLQDPVKVPLTLAPPVGRVASQSTVRGDARDGTVKQPTTAAGGAEGSQGKGEPRIQTTSKLEASQDPRTVQQAEQPPLKREAGRSSASNPPPPKREKSTPHHNTPREKTAASPSSTTSARSTAPTLDKAPTSKRKKNKKEGLQAMLQARKENEVKAQTTNATGLGLSSFLQSL